MSSSTAQIGLRIFLQDSASAGLGALGVGLLGLTGTLGRLNTAWGKLSPAMQSTAIGAAVTGLAFAGMSSLLDQAVQAGSDLSSTMAQVQNAVQGADAQLPQMQNDLIQLADTSIFSTNEIGQGFVQLGINGENASEIMLYTGSAMTTLAEAINTGTVPAANLLGVTLQQFGLQGKDATKVVNDLTFSFYNGQGTYENVQNAYAAVAFQAHTMGISLGDVTVSLSILGEAGLKGQKGGLALKNMLIALADPTAAASKELSALGILTINSTVPAFHQLSSALENSGVIAAEAVATGFDGTLGSLQKMYTEAQNIGVLHTDQSFYQWAISSGVLKDSLYNANGTFKDMKTVIGLVGGALAGLNPQDKAAALSSLFNRTALRAAEAFFNDPKHTAAEWNALMKAMGQTSAVKDASNNLHTLAGSSKELSTTWQDTLARVGLQLQAPLIGLNNHLNSLLNTFVMAPAPVHQAAAVFLVLGTALLGLTSVGLAVAFIIGTMGPVIGAVALPVLIVAGALVALGAVIFLVVTHWKQITSALQPAFKLFQEVGGFLRSVFTPVFKDLGKMLGGELRSQFVYLQQVLMQVQPAWQQFVSSMQPVIPTLKTFGIVIGVVLGIVAAVVVGVIIGVVVGVFKMLVGVLMGLGIAFSGVFKVIIGIIQIVAGIFQLFTGVIMAVFQGHWSQIPKIALSALNLLWSGVKNIFSGIALTIYGLLYGMVMGVKGLITGFVQGIIGFFTHLWDVLVGHSIIPDMVKGIISWIVQLVTQGPAHILSMVTGILVHFGQLELKGLAIVVAFVGSIISRILTFRQNMINHASALVSGFIGKLAALPGQATSAVQSMTSRLMGLLTSFQSKMAGLGSSIVQGLVNGIKSMGASAVGAMTGLGTSMLNGFKSMFHISSPSQVMHQMGGFVSQGLLNGITSLNVADAASKHFGQIIPATKVAVAGITQATNAAIAATPRSPQAAFAGAYGAGAGATTVTAQPIVLQVDGKNMTQVVMYHTGKSLRLSGINRLNH